MEIGHLVSLYRRIDPGIGIAISVVDDVLSLCPDGEKLAQKLINEWNNADDFRKRNNAIYQFIENSGLNEDIVTSFLQSNRFYRYTRGVKRQDIKKLKRKFVKIYWITKPSDYNIKITRRNIDWFPVEWLKSPENQKKLLDKQVGCHYT